MFDGRVYDMLTRVNGMFQATYNNKWSEYKASNKKYCYKFSSTTQFAMSSRLVEEPFLA